MKRLFAVLAISGTLVACNNGADNTTDTDTTTITTDTNTLTIDTTGFGTGTDTTGFGTGRDTVPQ